MATSIVVNIDNGEIADRRGEIRKDDRQRYIKVLQCLSRNGVHCCRGHYSCQLHRCTNWCSLPCKAQHKYLIALMFSFTTACLIIRNDVITLVFELF